MKRVILLAGHNFKSPGCHTVIDGKIITEFDLTTWLVAEVFKKERLIGIDLIIKARNEYKDLVNEVNTLNADYLISCHFNAYNEKTQGTEVLYSHKSAKGKDLAIIAQKKLIEHLGLNDRGIKSITLKDRGGAILNKTKPVAILLEPFFLDNITDKKVLDDLMKKTENTILAILNIINNL